MNDPEHTKAYKPEQPTAPDETVDDVGAQTEHPNDETLLQLAAGRLDKVHATNVKTHLTSCAQCTERLSQLGGTIVSFVDGIGSTQSPQGEPTAVSSSPDETVDHPTPCVDTTSDSSVPSFGDYELLDEIARGGMGVVYKAHQKSLNRIVALKMIKSGEFANQEQVDRFYKEAEAAANLDHPGIVPVYEVGEVEGQHYFTMGFVDGESLSERLRNGPLPPKKATAFAKSISEAIDYAHSKGVIHRDLKPGNVLITQDGVLRITDFGLAKRIEDDSELTSIGQVLGTPSYMPPEQAEGRLNEIGTAADIYAIGATLYCMLVGHPPFQAANVIETLQQVLDSDPVSLSSQNKSVPADLETICFKCLEKKASNRYQSSAAVGSELSRFLGGEPIHARRIGRFERAIRWCKRKPAQAIAAAAVLTLAIVGPWSAIQQSVSNRRTATARVDALLNASPAAIPVFLTEIDRDISVVESRLRELATPDLTPSQQLRLSLALLPVDSTQLTSLANNLTECSYDELATLLDRLKEHGGDQLVENLWETFHGDEGESKLRFRAGLALAALDAESKQWTDKDYNFLVTSTLEEISVYQPAIRQVLKPLGDRLLPALTKAFDESNNLTVQESAAMAIVDFAEHNSTMLTNLAASANAKQFSIIYPEVAELAGEDEVIVDQLIEITKLQPAKDLNEAQRVALGKRRAGAAICLLRMGYVEESLEVLRVKKDPESLTQFVHRCKARTVTVTDLLHMLSHATSVTERYGLLVSIGEFPLDDIPSDIRTTWVDHVKALYANDPSSGIHGACGWLLREWGLNEDAKAIEERDVPYSKDREWFTLKVNLAGPLEFENYGYFTFVVFPAGEYEIGSLEYEADRDSTDERRRTMTITRPFAVLDREVNREEYNAVTGFSGYGNEKEWAAVTTMSGSSWYMSVHFCRELSLRHSIAESDQAYLNPSAHDGERDENYWSSAGISTPPKNWEFDLSKAGFRLPTAAEWEIACRGDTVSRYDFGCDVEKLRHYGWYEDVSDNRGHGERELRPNLQGLFDMHGNMFEWCHDWAGGKITDETTDPVGFSEGVLRLVRGGGWGDNAINCRSASRFDAEPSHTSSSNGFRVALSLGVSSSHPQ